MNAELNKLQKAQVSLNSFQDRLGDEVVQKMKELSIQAIELAFDKSPEGKTKEDTIDFLRQRVTNLCVSDQAADIIRKKGIEDEEIIKTARELAQSVFIFMLELEIV